MVEEKPRDSLTNDPLLLPVAFSLDIVKQQILQNLQYTIAIEVVVDVHIEHVRAAEIRHSPLGKKLVESGAGYDKFVVRMFGGRLLAEAGLAAVALGLLGLLGLVTELLVILFVLVGVILLLIVGVLPRCLADAEVLVGLVLAVLAV